MNTASADSEIELKLRIPREAVQRVVTHPLLRSGTPPVTRKLYSIYFDTPDHDLWRHGIALRVRKEGARWMQAVKGGGTARGGLHRRIELETEVSGPLPDCAAIGGGVFGGLFSSPGLCVRLKPVFVTEFDRQSRMITLKPDVKVEVCADCGEIKCGDSVEPISEIELELKSGPSSQLYEIALKFLDSLPLAIENRSKAERGYALLRGDTPLPVKAHAAALTAEMPVGDAFKATAWAGLDHLQANERGVLDSRDPEYLHQARVALRRLRSIFGVFADVLSEPETAPLVRELEWLADRLGPARDWDVFMIEVLPPILRELGNHDGLSAFKKRCALLRQAAKRRARHALRSQRYQRLILMLSGWLVAESPPGHRNEPVLAALRAPTLDFAAAVLEEQYSRVRKRGRKLQHLSFAELHRLRIAIKKLRYAVDFFAVLFDAKPVDRMRAPLVRLQDILGAINDATTVAALIAEVGARSGTAMAEARGIVIGWSGERAETLKRELHAAWKPFHDCGKFW